MHRPGSQGLPHVQPVGSEHRPLPHDRRHDLHDLCHVPLHPRHLQGQPARHGAPQAQAPRDPGLVRPVAPSRQQALGRAVEHGRLALDQLGLHPQEGQGRCCWRRCAVSPQAGQGGGAGGERRHWLPDDRGQGPLWLGRARVAAGRSRLQPPERGAERELRRHAGRRRRTAVLLQPVLQRRGGVHVKGKAAMTIRAFYCSFGPPEQQPHVLLFSFSLCDLIGIGLFFLLFSLSLFILRLSFLSVFVLSLSLSLSNSLLTLTLLRTQFAVCAAGGTKNKIVASYIHSGFNFLFFPLVSRSSGLNGDAARVCLFVCVVKPSFFSTLSLTTHKHTNHFHAISGAEVSACAVTPTRTQPLPCHVFSFFISVLLRFFVSCLLCLCSFLFLSIHHIICLSLCNLFLRLVS
eukprot:m.88831 g.88831  ORF g.88831 m.88831 type:complete len:404 (-) comp15203_c0_seq1:359-1570(-)